MESVSLALKNLISVSLTLIVLNGISLSRSKNFCDHHITQTKLTDLAESWYMDSYYCLDVPFEGSNAVSLKLYELLKVKVLLGHEFWGEEGNKAIAQNAP